MITTLNRCCPLFVSAAVCLSWATQSAVAHTTPDPEIRLRIEHRIRNGQKVVEISRGRDRWTVSAFEKDAEEILRKIESDPVKRNESTVLLAAAKDIPAGAVQRVLQTVQKFGFQKFSLRAVANESTERIQLKAQPDGTLASLHFRDQEFSPNQIEACAAEIASLGRTVEIEISAPAALQYGELIGVLNALQKLASDKGERLVSKIKFRSVEAPQLPEQQPVPKLSAVVTAVKALSDRTFVEISIGSDDGLKKGHKLQLYRQQPEPQKRKLLGRIEIMLVSPDRAVGKLIEAQPNLKVQKGDRVATKL